ncbi:MAG: hypothetical protein LQ338_005153 [Usnochroma carphineum]|nr:MAG: hypothetical protein LQ338_005153 [Usnochroma carphineum]
MHKRQGDGNTSSEATPTSTIATAIPTTTSQAHEVNEAINITLDGQIFPPSIHIEGVSSTSTTDFAISCIDCSIVGDFGLSAGDQKYKFETPSDVEARGKGTFNFDDIWVAATCDYLNATFEFAVNLTASNETNFFSIPLYTQSKTLERGPFTLSATLSTELYGWVNTSSDVNLTYGFNFMVPPDSEIIIDVENPENSASYGFNETSLVPIPLNSTRSDLDIAIEVGFRPSVAFVVALGAPPIAGASVSLDVGLDIPKLDLDIKQVHNVTSNCDPAAPSLLSNRTKDDTVYENLTLVTPSLGLDVFEVLTESGELPGAKLTSQHPFNQSFSRDLATQCLFFDAAKKTLGPASATKPARMSRAADRPVIPLAATFTAVAAVAGFMIMMM